MRYLLVLAVACGGGDKPAPATPAAPAVEASGCARAYTEYEAEWSTARSAELAEAEFDDAAIAEVVRTEVATLPNRSDLAKLRAQYAAVALFLPDSPWPRALDAADVAIDACGEASPRPAA
jgi:hypothetical protein